MPKGHYRFGNFTINVLARELRRDGRQVALPPKSFECLAYLIEHRDRAVGRDELISAVWGRADVSDALLAQTLMRVRKVVGDSGSAQRMVRTVSRFGYRWVGPIESEAETEPLASLGVEDVPPLPADAADGTVHPHGRRRGARTLAVWLAAAVAAAVLLVAGWQLRPRPAPPAVEATEHELVVVLPVHVSGADTDMAWLRLGAMDYLATRLGDDARMRVLPSERVVALLGTRPDRNDVDPERLREIERITGAAYLIAPRAVQVEGRWRFALDVYHGARARSFRAEDRTPLDAAHRALDRFLQENGGHTTMLAVPNERLQRIDAALLSGDLGTAAQLAGDARTRGADDPALLLRAGAIEFRSGRWDAAEALFAAVAETPDPMPAQMRTRARAVLGLAGVLVRRRDFDGAVARYGEAIGLLGDGGDPRLLGRAYMERGVSHSSSGRTDLAMRDFGRARLELARGGDPMAVARLEGNFAIAELHRGRYREAVAAFDRAVETFERFGVEDSLATVLAGRVDAQLALLDLAGAVSGSTRAWALAPRLKDPNLVEFIALRHLRALRGAGRLSQAREVLEQLETLAPQAAGNPQFAVLDAGLLLDAGHPASALRMREQVFERMRQAPQAICRAVVPQAALVLVESALRSGFAGEGERILAELDGLAEMAPDDPAWRFAAELSRAQLAAFRDDERAAQHFDRVLALAEADRDPDALIVAATAYANHLGARPDPARAASLAGRLAPYVERDYRAARSAAQLYTLIGERALAKRASQTASALAGEREPARARASFIAL